MNILQIYEICNQKEEKLVALHFGTHFITSNIDLIVFVRDFVTYVETYSCL